MTPAQKAQVAQCKRMWLDGASPDDMRALGFAAAAINAAMRGDEGGAYGENNGPVGEAAQ